MALSYFAFSLSPVTSQARQPLPTQIEQVVSSADDSEDNSFSVNQITFASNDFTHEARSAAYEKYILIAHQKKFITALKDYKEKSLPISIPEFHQTQWISHPDSEDDLPPSITC